MIAYLCASGQITADVLQTFRPAVCNRLDRNTSGLVLGREDAGRLTGTVRDAENAASMHK